MQMFLLAVVLEVILNVVLTFNLTFKRHTRGHFVSSDIPVCYLIDLKDINKTILFYEIMV